VFHSGRIVEGGRFDELIQRGGYFAELARSQFMAGEPAKKRHEPASGQPVET
jgi:ATP-binding cassette subfamily B protein